MPRRLFSELGPVAYEISVFKSRVLRTLRDAKNRTVFARTKSQEPLPAPVYAHRSLIRRKLGDVDMQLQENKAVNLALAAPRLNGVLIRPGETFSLWALLGRCTARKGYRPGLTLRRGTCSSGVGGGLCQLSNLLHWLFLHSPLKITEHHHHDGYDLFPDFGRQVPFGCGTSILFKRLDYRVKNTTHNTFQLLVHTDGTHLCGELRAMEPVPRRYHIRETESRFVRMPDGLYRENTVERRVVDPVTGNLVARRVIRRSHAKVMYDESHIDASKIVLPNPNVPISNR